MRFLKLTLSYDGTDFAGWQVQPGRRTVQSSLEQALEKITGETIRVLASGRTDAGVHALGQVISFSTESHLSCDVLWRALNGTLPSDMSVLEIQEAPQGFHAIRDAKNKRYRYVIDEAQTGDVFSRRYCWQLAQTLNVPEMNKAAMRLMGRHDFASFESSGSPRCSSVRTVSDVFVVRRREGSGQRVVVEIQADGFLYNMVRSIVGTLLEVGRGSRREDWISEVLNARDRRAAGATSPPHGLFLVCVKYE